MTFTKKVLEVVKTIPRGQTMSYCQVAALAGNKKAARVVGTILSKNYDPAIPCHRVIRATGQLGKYNRGADKKAALLKQEKQENYRPQ
ncbi:MGMT family protein [bacterium]|jgi:O-6-methylguanine DNA methyltransferase|nr:MGMT family protein [bacterium]MBT5015661.1 MGMT family protein [bacterium]